MTTMANSLQIGRPPVPLSLRIRHFVENLFLYAFLIGISAFMLIPFIWMVSTSLKPPDEIFTKPPVFLSPHANLDSYNFLFQNGILRNVANSFIIALVATLLSLFF